MEKYSVILMDDDTDDLYLLSDAMQQSGKFFVVATGTAEADLIRVLESSLQLPDAIVCDLNITPVNAIKIHYGLRGANNYASIPFILLSGTEPSALTIKAAINEGLLSIFLKPNTINGYHALCENLFDLLATQRLKSI